MSNTLVFVYSVPRKSVLGISEWVNESSGRKLDKTKVGKCATKIRALYNPKVGGLANYISYTPWIEDGVQRVDEKGNPLTLQDKMEQKWGKPKGYFTNRAWQKGDSLKDEDLTYFQKMAWQLEDGSTVFDLSIMDQELGYYVLLGAGICANSEKEWRSHKWPKAEFYIALENEGEEIQAKKNSTKRKAFAALENPDFTDNYKRKFVSLLDLASFRSTLTTTQVDNLLYDYIDKSGFTPGSNIDKFTDLYKRLSTPDGREYIESYSILKQAIDYRVVYEKQGSYTWNRAKGSLNIGDRLSEAIDFISNPKKAAEVEDIVAEIKLKSN